MTRRIFNVIAVTIVTLLAALVFSHQQASAISHQVPDPANFDSSGGYDPNVWLEVSQSGLIAPLSDVRFYMNYAGAIDIMNGRDNCNTLPGPDVGSIPTTYTFTWYSQPTNTWTTYASRTSSSLGCGNDSIPAPPSECVNYRISYIKTVCLVEMSVTTGGAAAAVNAFKAQIQDPGNGFATYFGGSAGNKFAMQDRKIGGGCDPSGACPASNFNLYFAPNCNISQTQINDNFSQDRRYYTIKWFDDDTGNPGVGTPGGMRVRIDRMPFGGGGAYTNIAEFYANSGNNVDGQYVLPAGSIIADHIYRVTWYSVDRNNGIQFALPFDSIFSKVDCRPAYVDGIKVGINNGATSGSDSATQVLASGQNAGPSFPFADDEVKAIHNGGGVIHSIDSNPFFFTGATELDARNGVTFQSEDAGGTPNGSGWTRIGYTICDETVNPDGSCNAAFLLNRNNLRTTPVNLQPGHKYHMRWLYEQAGSSEGNLTLTCVSNGSVTANATFSDDDGPTDAYITYGAITTAIRTSSPTTWTGIPSGSTVTLYVKNVPGNSYSAKAISSETCPPSTGLPCPLDPVISGSKDQPIPVAGANKPADDSGDGNTSGYSGSPNAHTGSIYTYDGTYIIDSVKDQYNQAATSFTPSSRDDGPFTADYTDWVNDYPYDSHEITATYRSYYKQAVYKSSSTPTYYCDSGYNLSSGPTCSQPGTATGTYTCTANCGTPTQTGTCSAGSPPSCSYPVTNYGTVYTHYAISYDSTNEDLIAPAKTVAMHTLNQCYYRGVNISPDPNTKVNSTTVDDSEDPSDVRFEATGAIIFSKDSAANPGANNTPRNPNSAVLTYTAHPFYSSDPNATSGANVPNCSDISGSMVLTVASFGQVRSGITNPQLICTGLFVPPMSVGDYFCVRYDFRLTSNIVDQTGTFSGNNTQTYDVTSCQDPIINKPYAHFFGGDVAAGGAFANGLGGCASGANTDIAGFVKNPGSSLTRGTSAQFGALAEGRIDQFGSASLRTTSPTGYSGLSFANTGNPGGVLGFHGTDPCIPDYYYTSTLATPVAAGSDGSGINTGPAGGAFSHTGNMSINGMNIANGASIVVYVDGNLTITDNIRYAGAGSGWGDATQVPSLFFVVKGNINIDNDVTELDGVYIAQPNGGSGGIINTCTNGSAQIAVDNLLSSCGSTLTVNGAFISQNVKLYRAYKSIRNSQGGETPAGGVRLCDQNGRPGGTRSTLEIDFDCAAEIFHLPPEVYIGIPRLPQTGGPSTGKFDFITTIQPVL